MEFSEGHLYHIYNRGIDKKRIFYNPANYFFFLNKVRKNIYPYCDILAYSLMPNHFHFLIHANEITCKRYWKGLSLTNRLSEGFGNTLSSYCKAINNQEMRTGNLFQQNTKAKLLTVKNENYSRTCFDYIHQNPMRAGLVQKMEDWPYSSFRQFLLPSEENLCNKSLAFDLLDLNSDQFYRNSYEPIQDERILCLFTQPLLISDFQF